MLAALLCRAGGSSRLSRCRPILFTIRWWRSRTAVAAPVELSGGFFPSGGSGGAERRAHFSVQSECAVRYPDDRLPAIEKLARSVSGILVVDEAYVDFAASEGASTIPLIHRLPNLVVLRTFSKSFSLGRHAHRAGFCRTEEIIAGMMKVKDSYNLNRLSLLAGNRCAGGSAMDDAQCAAHSTQPQKATSAGSSAWDITFIHPRRILFWRARSGENHQKRLRRTQAPKDLRALFRPAGSARLPADHGRRTVGDQRLPEGDGGD